MWQSEKARNEAIRRMLAGIPGLKFMWGDLGPADAALKLRDLDGGYLSSGERVMLMAAFDLWNGSGHCRVSDLIDTLDKPRLRAVAEALLARDAST